MVGEPFSRVPDIYRALVKIAESCQLNTYQKSVKKQAYFEKVDIL